MPQSGILSFNSCHVGFANNLVTISDEMGVDLEPIGHVEEALPTAYPLLEGLKSLCATLSYHPIEDSGLKVVNGCPQPDFVVLVRVPLRLSPTRGRTAFLNPQKFVIHA